MVRTMSYAEGKRDYFERQKEEHPDRDYNYFDINEVRISGRIVTEPRVVRQRTRDTLEFRLAYRKGEKSHYVDVLVIDDVENAEKGMKRGSYVYLQGFINEREVRSDNDDTTYTETILLVDRFRFIPALGKTPPEVYDIAKRYDE